MNKLLVALGVITLVAVGSVGAWKLSGTDRRVGALGPLESPVPLSWRGAWSAESKYEAGEVVSYGGASYVADEANGGQTPNAKEGPWALMAARGLQGATGPAGTFSGTLQSPNGGYSLTIADDGITMQGPGGKVALKDASLVVEGVGSITMRGGTSVTVDAASQLQLKGAAQVRALGATVLLNCMSGTYRVARQGDPVQVVTGAQGTASTGQIMHGSPSVFAC